MAPFGLNIEESVGRSLFLVLFLRYNVRTLEAFFKVFTGHCQNLNIFTFKDYDIGQRFLLVSILLLFSLLLLLLFLWLLLLFLLLLLILLLLLLLLLLYLLLFYYIFCYYYCSLLLTCFVVFIH